jgi:hypothetical protein
VNTSYFSEFGLICAQPVILAIWQSKGFSKVRQNPAILLASGRVDIRSGFHAQMSVPLDADGF